MVLSWWEKRLQDWPEFRRREWMQLAGELQREGGLLEGDTPQYRAFARMKRIQDEWLEGVMERYHLKAKKSQRGKPGTPFEPLPIRRHSDGVRIIVTPRELDAADAVEALRLAWDRDPDREPGMITIEDGGLIHTDLKGRRAFLAGGSPKIDVWLAAFNAGDRQPGFFDLTLFPEDYFPKDNEPKPTTPAEAREHYGQTYVESEKRFNDWLKAGGGMLTRTRKRSRRVAAAKKFRPVVKTHGGKSYLARPILEHFPSHQTYVEPFAGGLSVLLNKTQAAVEVASDLNGDLIGLYRVLQSDFAALAARLDPLPYTEDVFNQAASWLASDDPLEHAVGFLVRNRFSRGGLGKDFAWSKRLRGGRPGDLNAWETFKAQLPRVADRLRSVDIRQAPAIEVIRQHDGPDALHYCDPPYMHSTRTVRDAYEFEMTEAEHAELLDVLMGCHGTVVVSGYPSPLYDARLAGWRRIVFEMPNHAGQGKSKQRRQEVIWINR
jgi:DNA adenine methylase